MIGSAQPNARASSCTTCMNNSVPNEGRTACICPSGFATTGSGTTSMPRSGLFGSERLTAFPYNLGSELPAMSSWNIRFAKWCDLVRCHDKSDAVSGVSDTQFRSVGCPTGTFSTEVGATSSATCKQCPAGTFQGSSGASTCTNCPFGQTAVNPGAAGESFVSASLAAV
jgi:hypothetical protein